MNGPDTSFEKLSSTDDGSRKNQASLTNELGQDHPNILSLLHTAAHKYPDKGLAFYRLGQLEAPPERIGYLELLGQAKDRASQLNQIGIKPGTIILLHFNTHIDNLLFFWSVVCAGYIPAMSTPFSNNLEQRQNHIDHLNCLLGEPLCLTRRDLLPEFSTQSKLKIVAVETLPKIPSEKNLQGNELWLPFNQGRMKERDDLAALMLTSGSSGNTKAVCLTHGQILASITGKSSFFETGPSTPFFNWIGADHVACLTEIHIHALMVGADQIHAQATDIVPDPLAFLKIIQQNRIAHSFAPNFFLAALLYALRTSAGEVFQNELDLSYLKTIVSGGEANVVETCSTLGEILELNGAPPNCLKPGFGMTETSAGSIYNKSFPFYDVQKGYEFASLGECIQGMEIQITDEFGDMLPIGVVGNLEIRGSVVFSGYFNDPKGTAESFRDGWFLTGDRGQIDSAGFLSLSGRTKETIIINGVNYLPHSIEASLENSEGLMPSFTLIFPYRERNSSTENVCVVYRPSYHPSDIESRVRTNNIISSTVLLQMGVRPLIVPVNETVLQKSTLGKLSRNKCKILFENGDLDIYRESNEKEMVSYQMNHFEPVQNDTEQFVLDTFIDVLGIPNHQIGVTSNLFAVGVNSIGIIKIKQKLQTRAKKEIPTITIISNPTARGLAVALQELQKPHEYNPLVVVQGDGSQTPLWLIHPGVGEVLVFLTLAPHFKDRPLYAIRARGFEDNERYFHDIEEAVTTYHRTIKEVQPDGPYAIAGYSFGSMLAFEISKLLKNNGDDVRFLGIFNLPPSIKVRMRQLNWINCLLHLSYFLGFFSEDYAHSISSTLQQQSRRQALEYVLDLAPQNRMEELGLDTQKFANWVNLAYSLQSSAIDYEPSGIVGCMDVFCAKPLASVAKDMNDWMTNHLGKWVDFCETLPRFHCVDGAHYTMLGPEHILTFSRTLRAALDHRNV